MGVTARLKTLRGDCLQRDRHRCVISRVFDVREAIKRSIKGRDNYIDDDGQPLGNEVPDKLEVAHILPHSLVKTNSESKLVCFSKHPSTSLCTTHSHRTHLEKPH